jgi:flagellar M-ring protein FliF
VNLEQIFSRLKTLGGSLTVAQRMSLLAAFVTVVGLVAGSAYFLNQQTYVLLFSDLDAEAASSVVAKLKTLKVPYALGDGGRTVRVPDSRADELRLEFASQGMPATGRIGFEIFDKVSFGATEFIEQVNFQRALEGEIARTISTISDVSSARVQIVVAKSSLFETRERPATASVVLKLRGRQPLAPSTVQGIIGLVAGAVEGLRPDAVVVLDSYGRTLSKQGQAPDSPNGGPSMERQFVLERDLTTKLVTLLEPVVGEGRVRVNVAVRLNTQTEEQTEERWDPTTTVVRGRQIQSDTSVVPPAGAGVAGARANLPPDSAKPASDPVKPPESRMAGRSAETTNYEISRLTRHTIKPNGEVARLSVAVILDDEPVVSKGKDGKIARKNSPRPREELQKIQGLVSAAVGLDTTRGDQLTVENVSFDDRPAFEDVPEQSFWQRYSNRFTDAGRVVTVLVLGLMAFVMFVRPLMRRVMLPLTAEPVPVAALPDGDIRRSKSPTIEELEGAIEAELDAVAASKGGDGLKVPVLSRRVGALAQKQPDHAAQLVRAWIQEDRR